MTKICYMHLGLHKTASTSFQDTCIKNVERLKNNGITYPLFKCLIANKTNIGNHSIPFYSLFCTNPREYHISKRWGICEQVEEVNSHYEEQLNAYLETSENLLISGEGISLLAKQELIKLVDKIRRYDFRIQATALVRAPYSMLCSGIQETIKGGAYNELISLNDSATASRHRKTESRKYILENLRFCFGNSISFNAFENACTNQFGPSGYIIQEFLNQDPTEFEYKNSNQSLFNLTVRLQNELNKVNPIFVRSKLNPDHQKLSRLLNKNLNFSGKFLLTEHEYSLVKKHIEKEVEDLHEITGLDELRNESVKFSKRIY